MSRYYIDTDDGRTSVRDEIGFDYLSVKEAARAALNALPDMARDATPDGAQRVFRAAARDERGVAVYRATLTLQLSTD